MGHGTIKRPDGFMETYDGIHNDPYLFQLNNLKIYHPKEGQHSCNNCGAPLNLKKDNCEYCSSPLNHNQ